MLVMGFQSFLQVRRVADVPAVIFSAFEDVDEVHGGTVSREEEHHEGLVDGFSEMCRIFVFGMREKAFHAEVERGAVLISEIGGRMEWKRFLRAGLVEAVAAYNGYAVRGYV
jgi:hypothetical protein